MTVTEEQKKGERGKNEEMKAQMTEMRLDKGKVAENIEAIKENQEEKEKPEKKKKVKGDQSFN